MTETNDLLARIAVLEAGHGVIREDIREIKTDVKGLRTDYEKAQQGFSRSEKLTLAGVGIMAGSMVIAAIALIAQAPG